MPSLIKTLDSLPKPAIDEHLWADYIELLCLFDTDGVTSKELLLDRIQERRDLGGELEELEAEIEEDYVEAEENDDEDAELPVEIAPSELDDKWESRTTDWFEHLKYRSAVFGQFYPFVLTDDGAVLERRSEITERHKLYVFLLVLSNLKYFRKHHNILTSGFEIISWVILKSFLPEDAHAHVFSRNRDADDRYKKLNLWGKINKLAADLNDAVEVPEKEFRPKDNADNGLDLVGWVPFHEDDAVNGMLVLFGQCACTDKWISKQSESSRQNWGATLRLKVAPGNLVFIPFCFRNSDGTWFRAHDIQVDTILVDRPRLLYSLRRNYEVFQRHPSYTVVNRLLLEHESIV